jgi:hypothetical protein
MDVRINKRESLKKRPKVSWFLLIKERWLTYVRLDNGPELGNSAIKIVESGSFRYVLNKYRCLWVEICSSIWCYLYQAALLNFSPLQYLDSRLH